MLPRMTVLQVGDVHLPRTAMLGRHLDDKDRRFPTDLRQVLGEGPVKLVFRTLHRLLDQESKPLLLFMGDFAEQGKLQGYQACARYLAEALQLGTGRRFSDLTLGIVPGNHDIDRALASKPGLKTKFQPLQRALSDVGLPPLPIDAPIWLEARNGACRIDVALLNSCWGCGAKEFIPEEFRDGIATAIDAALAAGTDERAINSYYDRQLDTPAFSSETIQRLIDHAAKLPGGSLIVAVAHHNILPQRLPRLSPYTELVNAGVLRSALTSLGRAILYLHGHIHEDPVEIVSIPSGAPLLSISAPEISSGFNQIDLVFTASGLPLTCSVRRWRFDESGVFQVRSRQIISIGSGHRRQPTTITSAIYEEIVKTHSSYWRTLVGIAKAAGAIDPEDTTEEALETIAADQLATIENYDVGREHWIVRSKL
ncbi:metallophosphoesterase [Rhodopseudomonas palustris BisB5]|uniref:Metallophosphoesterase n=1 Tax=Rhodopseudomonas palustris (strain BisB5) TaxID=316057 RepID=Q131R7_RHOPS|nr:metallophosphoesterase [Rhodopseudomonas palustris BisB5]